MAYSHKMLQRTQLSEAIEKSKNFIAGNEDDAFEVSRKSNAIAAERAMKELATNILNAADSRAREEWEAKRIGEMVIQKMIDNDEKRAAAAVKKVIIDTGKTEIEANEFLIQKHQKKLAEEKLVLQTNWSGSRKEIHHIRNAVTKFDGLCK